MLDSRFSQGSLLQDASIGASRPFLTLQAWGLIELKRGNFPTAILLLERSVAYDPSFSPVLRWRQVIEARNTLIGDVPHGQTAAMTTS